jgi:hypothetical protein
MSITTNTNPCWIVTKADGSPAGFEDSEPHFDTEAEACEAQATLTEEGEPPLVVKQLDNLCSEAVTACGYRYDEDDEGFQHWPDSAQEFQDWLTNLGYRLDAGGELLCPVDHGCEECDAIVLRQYEAGLVN